MVNIKSDVTDYIEMPLGDLAKEGNWHLCRAPWGNDNSPHFRIILAVIGSLAIYMYGTTKPSCAAHGPGPMTIMLERKTYLNTSAVDVWDGEMMRHPGVFIGPVDKLTYLATRKTSLHGRSRGGLLSGKEVRRLRKAMGYHDLLRRVLEQPLERKPVLHDTVYVRDMAGMMEAGVVLACADNGTYGVAIAARGQDLKHDLSYPDAGLDTARSFDPEHGRRTVHIDDVVAVMGRLCKKQRNAMHALSLTDDEFPPRPTARVASSGTNQPRGRGPDSIYCKACKSWERKAQTYCKTCGKDVCSRCRKTGNCHIKRHTHGDYGQGYSGGRTSRLY